MPVIQANHLVLFLFYCLSATANSPSVVTVTSITLHKYKWFHNQYVLYGLIQKIETSSQTEVEFPFSRSHYLGGLQRPIAAHTSLWHTSVPNSVPPQYKVCISYHDFKACLSRYQEPNNTHRANSSIQMSSIIIGQGPSYKWVITQRTLNIQPTFN